MRLVLLSGVCHLSRLAPVLLCLAGAVLAPAHAARGDELPRLVILVSVDQLPREVVERSAPLFGEGGFRRLARDGADFLDARHDHVPTFTGPGHAVMLTGARPNRNGIVGNGWYSRREGAGVECVQDGRFPTVPPPDGGHGADRSGVSPLRLKASTVGDQLRAATGGRARVIAASLKARSAVLLGGWRPGGAYWFDADRCRFVSSTYYAERLPDWVEKFNAGRPCAPYLGTAWEKLRPESDYAALADVDDAPYEGDAFGLGRTFPHPVHELAPGDDVERFEAVAASPFGNDLLLRFVRAAIEAERLGEDRVPDLLAVSLSSNDSVGHIFGPHSQEVLDVTLRTDRQLADLMELLDRRVGEGRWTLALTSDHGVSPAPGYLERLGILRARDDHHRFDVGAARARVERRLAARLVDGRTPPGGVRRFFEAWEAWTMPFVYVDRDAARSLPGGVSFADFLDVVAGEIEALPGVARVYRRDRLEQTASGHDPPGEAVLRGWHAENGGDLFVQLEPYWIPVHEDYATTHGSPYPYDTDVPMLLYGAGIAPGRYARPTAVVDLAPTLSHLLGVSPPPWNEGRLLGEALR